MNWMPRSFEHSEVAACVAVFAAIALVEILVAPPARRVEVRIKPNHVIPTAVQVILLTYWSLYWPTAWDVPRIPLELVFAFGFDYFLDRARGRTWFAGIGPAPIVLSSNLFIRFDPHRFDGVLAIVAIAILSKKFIQREGRHIFNPSAFGLTVFGLAYYLSPWHLDFVDVAHQINLPPNMGELIFALGLIVALRVPIVAVTAGAALGLESWNYLPGSVITPWPYWPAMLLVFTFLATDPITIPRSGFGRVVFGLAVGLGTGLASNTLVAASLPDYFGKIMAVPVCNLLTPAMDAAGRLRIVERLLAPRYNWAHVALWCFIFLGTHTSWRKAGAFDATLHKTNDTPLIVARGAIPRCSSNPIFCNRFTLAAELEAWMGSR